MSAHASARSGVADGNVPVSAGCFILFQPHDVSREHIAVVPRAGGIADAAFSSMWLHQLFDRESSTYTYLIASQGSAALIDPVREQLERDLSLVNELGLVHVA